MTAPTRLDTSPKPRQSQATPKPDIPTNPLHRIDRAKHRKDQAGLAYGFGNPANVSQRAWGHLKGWPRFIGEAIMNPILGSVLSMGISSRSGLAQSMLQAHAQNQLANKAAFRDDLAQLQNTYPQMHATPEVPQERTPEEIREQLEARYAEMEVEAERKAKAALTACSACRWSNGAWCKQPLVIGLEQKLTLNTDRYAGDAELCGPEKALWELPEPKRTLWHRFIDWFLEPWADELATSRTKR